MSILTSTAKLVWSCTLAILLVSEVVPAPQTAPVYFYCYMGTKVLFFLVLGYLTPLAFRRFDALNWAIVVSAVSASFIEIMQGLIKHGHRFSLFELVAKLLVILAGFALGLNIRHDRRMFAGPTRNALPADRPFKSKV